MHLMKLHTHIIVIIITIIIIIPRSAGLARCYNSVYAFGDSLADAGNFILSTSPNATTSVISCLFSPYGESYFDYPTGRCSNGRLIIDFTAEFLGLPLLPPYLEVKHNNQSFQNFESGVNFAVAGATALDTAVLEEMGSQNAITNCSLRVQMEWFKDMLSSVCNTSSSTECSKQLLSSSLISMGGIGGNDYTHALTSQNVTTEMVYAYVPYVVQTIASSIAELIELGASTVMVPGNFPMGCFPCLQQQFETSDKSQYDSSTGCLNWLNQLAEYHNEQLQIALSRIRKLHPDANIVYADYYNALLQLYQSPQKFGFIGGEADMRACCGSGGGRYNYNVSALCGTTRESAIACENPSQSISWDGIHSTEAAYRWISQFLLQGNYTSPPITTLCVSEA